LHRLGIQAFRPILIEGNAIQLHPLVCKGYNADFDGDQMAVHLPMTEEAQKEARDYMVSTKNLLKPGTGEPIVHPEQDIVLGCFWLTRTKEGLEGEGKYFSSPREAIAFYQQGRLNIRAKIKVRISKKTAGESEIIETTVGRLIFNEAFPQDFEFINEEMKKKSLAKITAKAISRYPEETAKNILDRIKNIGFKYATLSGVSFAMDDLKTPANKSAILSETEKEAEKIVDFYNKGLLSEHERYDSLVRIWQAATSKINQLVPESLELFGSIYSMVSSAARGNWSQVNQLVGMRGLMVNPGGKVIELPVKSNFREGLKVLEYFISTHGARKGIADTALKTSVAGHLTRRLVDVAQGVIITEEDCRDDKGFLVKRKEVEEYGRTFKNRFFGRTLAKNLVDKKGSVLFKKGHLLSMEDAELAESRDIEEIAIRSPLSCKTPRGLCRLCYGYDLARNELVKKGETVGITAAQSIGEPGTQLTMRTFHYGGVLSKEDITLGLPQIEEIFEARTPTNPAVIGESDGVAETIEERDREKIVSVRNEKGEIQEYAVPFGRVVEVKKGDKLKAGDRISSGMINVKKLFELKGEEETQRYILNEIERIYLSQDAPTNEKHIEVIIRQMFSRVKITDEGDTVFAVDNIVEKADFEEENKRMKEAGKKPAKGKLLLTGITKTALTATSFLSAASFQETTRVLISAALEGKEDRLSGLKENVIMGRLIPAGTHFRKEYEEEKIEEEKKMEPAPSPVE
jgi:DNA-directed RNA polymerase subunit beta'